MGHIELWARRAAKGEAGAEARLSALLEHALKREFPEVDPGAPLRQRLFGMLRGFADRQAKPASQAPAPTLTPTSTLTQPQPGA